MSTHFRRSNHGVTPCTKRRGCYLQSFMEFSPLNTLSLFSGMLPLSRSPRITERDKLYDVNHEYSMTLWEKLAVCPDKKFEIPMIMDKNNIIVPVHDALLKYNISQNKWIEFYKYPQEIRFNSGPKRIQFLHFNSKANYLYILAANHIESIPDFIQINIKTNQYQKLSKFCKNRPLHYNCVEIGGNLHLFVQNRFNFQLKHSLFNKKLNNHTEIKISMILKTIQVSSIQNQTK